MRSRSFVLVAALLVTCGSIASATDSAPKSSEALWRFDTHG